MLKPFCTFAVPKQTNKFKKGGNYERIEKVLKGSKNVLQFL